LPVEKGSEVVGACLKNGLLINSPQPTMVRLIPPLIVTSKDIDDMMEILTKVLADVLH